MGVEHMGEAGLMQMQRIWAMPSADTFSVEPIAGFVRKYLRESTVSVDPFARNRPWATYTNDLNPNAEAQEHLEAADFLRKLRSAGVVCDLIIFDPPYSLNQCREMYESVGRPITPKEYQTWGIWQEHKQLADELLSEGGVFLHFGWHSNGMGVGRNYALEEVLLIAHGRAHNDTICIAERKLPRNQQVFSF